ncbi:MAG: fibronectin type III domain-containing protein, partial [Acidimicrobiales bacterium]|nr:fibronectin type III domain-containing protein [Acidimicrobiales bacterium]
VTWSAPADAGGGTVTDYTVQYRAQGGSTWLTFIDGTSATPSATITGLTVGTTYEVRIAARNPVGTGPWSDIATAQAQTPWTPASLPDGLALWLDASDSSTFTLASGAVAEQQPPRLAGGCSAATGPRRERRERPGRGAVEHRLPGAAHELDAVAR